MKTCKYCGKPLTLTPEYDMCMECQGRIMRELTIPQGAFATNSTQQMITHEEARDLVSSIGDDDFECKFTSRMNKLGDYITEQEAKDQAHEELKRDVKRFMELIPEVKFRTLQDEVYVLQQKLSKVGKKE